MYCGKFFTIFTLANAHVNLQYVLLAFLHLLYLFILFSFIYIFMKKYFLLPKIRHSSQRPYHFRSSNNFHFYCYYFPFCVIFIFIFINFVSTLALNTNFLISLFVFLVSNYFIILFFFFFFSKYIIHFFRCINIYFAHFLFPMFHFRYLTAAVRQQPTTQRRAINFPS